MLRETFLPRRTTKFILSVVWAKKSSLMVMVVFGLVANLLSLFPPIGMQVLIDGTITSGSPQLSHLILLLAVLAFFSIILSAYSTDLSARVVTGVILELHARLIRHIIRAPAQEIRKRELGEFVQRFSDLESAQSTIVSPAVLAIVELPFLIVALIIAWQYSAWLTLVVVTQAILVGVFGVATHPLVRKQLVEQIASKERADTIMLESVSKLDEIKLTNQEGKFENRMDDQIAETGEIGLKTALINNVLLQIRTILTTGGSITVLGLGGLFIMSNQMSVGELVAFTLISSRISSPAQRIFDFARSWQYLQSILERLEPLISVAPERYSDSLGANETDNNQTGLIVQNILPFNQPDRSGTSFSFVAPLGALTLLKGASGSGKTTILRKVASIDIAPEATIFLNGQNLDQLAANSYRRHISSFIRPIKLFDTSIYENIAVGDPKISKSMVSDIIQELGMNSILDKFENGIDSLVSNQMTTISNGERTLICLARTLSKTDKILYILDEPLVGLDAEHRARVMRYIKKMRPNASVLVTSHTEEMEQIADFIVCLK